MEALTSYVTKKNSRIIHHSGCRQNIQKTPLRLVNQKQILLCILGITCFSVICHYGLVHTWCFVSRLCLNLVETGYSCMQMLTTSLLFISIPVPRAQNHNSTDSFHHRPCFTHYYFILKDFLNF